MSILGDRCRQRREEMGLSQTGLGKLCGVTQQAIGRLEDGTTKRPKFLYELSKALQRSVEWLTGQNHQAEADAPPTARAAHPRPNHTVQDILSELHRNDLASIRSMRECLIGDKSALEQLQDLEESARELRARLRSHLTPKD